MSPAVNHTARLTRMLFGKCLSQANLDLPHKSGQKASPDGHRLTRFVLRVFVPATKGFATPDSAVASPRLCSIKQFSSS